MVTKDSHIMVFICVYLRIMVVGDMTPYEFDNLMDIELDTHHEEITRPANALTRVADSLPGFGIVAAVLGIVITMKSIGGPPEELGVHVAPCGGCIGRHFSRYSFRLRICGAHSSGIRTCRYR